MTNNPTTYAATRNGRTAIELKDGFSRKLLITTGMLSANTIDMKYAASSESTPTPVAPAKPRISSNETGIVVLTIIKERR
jgi:hypothetical protein